MAVGGNQDERLTAAGVEHGCDAGLVRAFQFLGKRWSGVILAALAKGPIGYAELRRGVGTITDSVLSDRLTELAAGGLIERTVIDARPPGVTYALTGAGAALLPILRELAGWADEYLSQSCVEVE
jgi:DNA-binding HxlR family transcriptional regulator